MKDMTYVSRQNQLLFFFFSLFFLFFSKEEKMPFWSEEKDKTF